MPVKDENRTKLRHLISGLHSKWPRELKALRAMKTVFRCEIAKLLKTSYIKTIVTEDYLDIFYKGFVFRMYLYYPKEVAILKKVVTTGGVTVYKDTPESLHMERTLDVLPKLIGAFNG